MALGAALGLALPVLGGIASAFTSKKQMREQKQRANNDYQISQIDGEISKLESNKDYHATSPTQKIYNTQIDKDIDKLKEEKHEYEKRNEYKR